MKTYRIDFNNEPIIYVFDEDGVVSYTPQDTDALAKFFSEGIRIKQSPLRAMGAKADYAAIGSDLLKMVYSIAICRSSEELLTYLKKFRDAFEPSGMRLKCANGILREYYDTPKRITTEKAMKELKSIYRYGM